MIIYLYGPDSYRRHQRLKWFLDKFREKHSALTVERFDLSAEIPQCGVKEESPQLRDFVVNQSLFTNFKFGILYNVRFADSKNLAPILKSAKDTKNITLLISEDKKLPKEYDFLLKDSFVAENFENLKGAELQDFIRKEAAKRKINLSDKVFFEPDLWGIVNELDKMALGGKAEEYFQKADLFSLINKVKRGQVSEKIPAMEILLSTEEPAMVFNFIASQGDSAFKNLMADYDVVIKSGKLEYEEALLDLVLTASR